MDNNHLKDGKIIFPNKLKINKKFNVGLIGTGKIAQEYINLAYEMGGDNWYGAEEVWGTDAFKNRVNKLHEEDG